MSGGDADLVKRLREGDEEAFTGLIRKYHSSLIRLARTFVKTEASAEELAQETWMAVLEGIGRFEGRGSLKAWIFQILANRARTRAVKEGRTVLFSEAGDVDDGESAVDPSRFKPSGFWHLPPKPWEALTPERLLASSQALDRFKSALEELPENQRIVVLLRDVEGASTKDVCNILEISETHQRVLLHRGRSRLRRALENLMD